MKKTLLLLSFGMLSLNLLPAQPVDLSSVPANRPLMKADLEKLLASSTNSLPRFDLDFAGGTPGELVRAIEKATDKPLNTVIPNEFAGLDLPALSVKYVTAAQVFAILEIASRRNERHVWTDHTTPNRNPADFYFEHLSNYGFRTEGMPTENSIWYFYYDRPPVQIEPVVCKFYQLSSSIEAGYTVEDITTAVETAWKMLGVVDPPQIKYHTDTKVIIAVGETDKVELIGDVLKQLSLGKPRIKPVDK